MRFEERAAGYDTHAGPQAEVVRRLAARIPFVDTPVDTLELGAGTGLLTRELVVRGYAVRATDASPAMIAAGARAVPEAAWERLDAWRPPAACCDRLFSANVLQWCEAPADTLARHRAALRPGGRMAHAVFTEPTLCELHGLAGVAGPITRRTAGDWLDAARAAGLRVTRHEHVVFRKTYSGAFALLRELHGTGAVSGKAMLTPGALRRLIREYDRRHAAPGGGVTATWAALIFEAEPA